MQSQLDWSARRASEGDIQSAASAAESEPTRGKENIDSYPSSNQQEDSARQVNQGSAHPTRPGIYATTSASMTRAYSDQKVPTVATSQTTRPEPQSLPIPQVSIPDSLSPPSAGVDRPSADPSLLPLLHPTVGPHHTFTEFSVHPQSYASVPEPIEHRPQSRTRTSSTTPPNMYDCLPGNLRATLLIHPQDSRHPLSSNGSGLHSPVSPSLSPITVGSVHASYSNSWANPVKESTGASGPMHDVHNIPMTPYGYVMPGQYERTGSSGGMDSEGSSFSNGGGGHPTFGGQHAAYPSMPDTNMAYMSMHQTMNPQMHPGMAPVANGFAYGPVYQYPNGRHAAYVQATAGSWMNMAPNGYPYTALPFVGNPQDGYVSQQGPRGRGGGRGRGRGRGFRAPDHISSGLRSQNPFSSPTHIQSAWNGQPQWHSSEARLVPPATYQGSLYQQGDQQAFQPYPASSIPSGLAPKDIPSTMQSDARPLPARTEAGSEAIFSGEIAGRILERKPYHPAPPANRSEWVMWVGNVPANATHEEMWKFFNSPLDPEMMQNPTAAPGDWLGVASIFLISRSNCAFVNLKNESDLKTAIAYFNGKTLRPWDQRCQPFLCRIRKADDDLKSGVGGQRGAGIHIKYIKELRSKEKVEDLAQKMHNSRIAASGPTHSLSESTLPLSPAALEEPPEGEGRRRESVVKDSDLTTPAAFAAWQERQQQHGRSSSGEHSFASTCSSFLVKNFPKRFFIMKSSTKDELDKSIESGIWWTQPHNEAILDQAYRTSPEVYLIFGANKQGSFSGCAIMRSGIPAVARKHTSHSSVSQDTSYRSNGSRWSNAKSVAASNGKSAGLLSPRGPDIQEEADQETSPSTRTYPILSADSPSGALAMSSPGEMTPGDELRSGSSDSPLCFRWNQTAPHPDYNRISISGDLQARALTFDTKALARLRSEEALKQELAMKAKAIADDFELDQNAVRNAQHDPPVRESKSAGGVSRKDMISGDEAHAPAATQTTADHKQAKITVTEAQPEDGDENLNGNGLDQHSFKVEWVRIGELPFSAIKHLRNPWNQDKEVKVSRDGTELEPSVGAALLAEWDRLKDADLHDANKAGTSRTS